MTLLLHFNSDTTTERRASRILLDNYINFSYGNFLALLYWHLNSTNSNRSLDDAANESRCIIYVSMRWVIITKSRMNFALKTCFTIWMHPVLWCCLYKQLRCSVMYTCSPNQIQKGFPEVSRTGLKTLVMNRTSQLFT